MNLEFHLRAAGAVQVALAAIHLLFPKRFAWKEELPRLSLLNRQIFLVHTFFICVVLVLFGSWSFFLAPDLLRPSPLSRPVVGGIAVFWLLRLFCQWFVYDPSLWRGDRRNTRIHWAATAVWIYLAAVYATASFAG